MKMRGFRERHAIRTAALAAVLLALAAAAPGHAAAEEPTELPYRQYNGWEVTSFEVEGIPEGLAAETRKGLAQTGRWRLLGGMQRPSFHARQLAEDVARIRLLLAQQGYPSTVVTPEVTPDEGKRQLALRLRVDPGPPVRLADLELKGWPEGVAPPDTTDEDVVRAGEILVDERVRRGLAEIRNTLLDAGYASVEIDHEVVPAGPHRVVLVVEVRPGDFYTIDEVEVTGASDDLVGVARRVMNVRPGMDFSQQVVDQASLDLRTTQLFRMVVLETKPLGPGSLKLKAELENGRMRTWDASIGTWSDNPWMFRAGWTHRNLFKRGIGYDVRGVVATHRLGVGTGVFWLGWLSPRARTRVGLGFLVEDEDAYRSEEAGIDLVQSFRPRNRDIWNIGVTVSRTFVEEREGQAGVDIPETQGRLLEFWTDRKWDRADDPLFPSGGGFFKVRLNWAPPNFFTEVPYASAQIDGAKYLGFENGIVLAARGRVGAGTPLGDAFEIIATRRFYAGGYNTHRGYQRRRLGPRDADGNARGGEFVVLGGVEFRAPLIWKFGTAVFLDAGNLWAVPSDFRYDDVPVAWGLCLDLRTPLGPLRGVYARNIANQVAGEPRVVWHFGIGYPW